MTAPEYEPRPLPAPVPDAGDPEGLDLIGTSHSRVTFWVARWCGKWGRGPPLMGSHTAHREDLDVAEPIFGCPDINTFCLIDQMGLTVTASTSARRQ